ncbi:MAG: GtrA family protein, partial [Mycobacterium sp.]
MSFADATITRLPRFIRPVAERHHELIKFGIVGATTFIIDSGIFYALKLTILEPKPLTAKIISGIIAVIASYILNREWSFRDRGGREKHHEALLFFAVSGIGVLIAMVPLWISSYIFELRVPNVTLTVENIADFISAYIVGNLLQMAFRF